MHPFLVFFWAFVEGHDISGGDGNQSLAVSIEQLADLEAAAHPKL